MPDNIELLRCTLGNGWDIDSDYIPGAERIELTLQTLQDRKIRVQLTTAEVDILLRMRDDARRGD